MIYNYFLFKSEITNYIIDLHYNRINNFKNTINNIYIKTLKGL